MKLILDNDGDGDRLKGDNNKNSGWLAMVIMLTDDNNTEAGNCDEGSDGNSNDNDKDDVNDNENKGEDNNNSDGNSVH